MNNSLLLININNMNIIKYYEPSESEMSDIEKLDLIPLNKNENH